MILIETGKFKTFEEYLASLSKAARKNWRFARKHNEHVIYNEIKTDRVPYAFWNIQQWMDLWSQQLIRGERRTWAFRAEDLGGKNILFFEALDGRITPSGIAMQFVELEDGYMNCHPVMYEKEKYSKRYLSKFMWFSLMRWAIEHGVKVVDMGGGNDDDWHEMIRTRDQYPNPAYKWMYVPELVKKDPKNSLNYKVTHDGISKRISKID